MEDAPWKRKTNTHHRDREYGTARILDGDTDHAVTVHAPQRTPLKSVANMSKELAHVYRGVKAGTVASEEGSRRAYILNTLAKLIETADIWRGLDALEVRTMGTLQAPEANE